MSLEPPPQIVEPVAPVEPVEPRQPLGWVLLVLFFVLVGGISISGAVTRKPDAKIQAKTPSSPYELVLQSETNLRSLSDFVRQQNPQRAEEIKQQALDSLRDPISEIAESSTNNLEKARWYAAMRTEKGDPVPKENLAPLKQSKEPSDAVLAQIYEKEKLTPAEAKALVAKLPKEGLLFKLAKVQALEKAGDKTIRGETFPWPMALAFWLVSFGIVAVLLGGGLVWALFIRSTATRQIRPMGFALRVRNATDADRAALRAAEVLIAFMVVQIVVAQLRLPAQVSTIMIGLGILACLPVLAMTPLAGKKFSLRDVGIHFDDFWKNVGWGIAAFMAEIPVTLLLALIGSAIFSFLPPATHPASEDLLNAKNLGQVLPLILFGSLIAPIWEEFVFRGLLFPSLTRITRSIPMGAIASGFLFAVIHPQGPALWLSLAWIGIVGCVLNYHRRSLIPSIVMHMLHNLAIFVFSIVLIGLK